MYVLNNVYDKELNFKIRKMANSPSYRILNAINSHVVMHAELLET
jgi:hypothetical protein